MSSQVIEDIKSKLNVVDLIGEYIQLQKAGANWKACCPFHNEKTPSFSVSEEKQIWHCFGCGKGGDIFGFLMEIEGLEFKDALKDLAEKTGVELPRYQSGNYSQKTDEKNKSLEILELATKFFEKQLWEGAGQQKVLNYLRQRGLNDETIKEFRLGYAPEGWRNLSQFLTDRNYNAKDILKTGLLVEKNSNSTANTYDRFRDRIIFPITDAMGKVVGYTARVAPGGDESQAKYVNTPETQVYHKSDILYGMDKAKMDIKQADSVLLVEGNMDVIASYQAGIKNVVAVSGTALTVNQLNIIKRYTRNIKMFFDMDDAGQLASKKSACLAFEKELNVAIVEISNGKDAADVARDHLPNFLKAVKNAQPAMEYFMKKSFTGRDKKNIENKKKIIEDLRGLINSFTNRIEREYWIKELAGRLSISEKILFDDFNQAKQVGKFKAVASDKNEKQNGIVNLLGGDKVKNIQIEIMGMLLADSTLWQKALKKYKQKIEKKFSNEKIKDIILVKGREFNFELNELLANLPDENQKIFLRELCFKNIERDEEYNSSDDKWKTLEQYFFELEKELDHNKAEDLILQIKKAERNKEKGEVLKLTKKLAELVKK